MNQEKFGRFIKEIRKKNNLTQKQLADKYNVTYQAVSKWENGKNLPDTSLIKQISDDFNVSLEELFAGESKSKDSKKFIFILSGFILVLLIFFIILITKQNDSDFEFKTLSSNCDNFNISGNIAYNKNKSAIYITNIKYCGDNNTEYYRNIECILYESHDNIDRKISSYKYDDEKGIKIEEFLEMVTLTVDDYEKTCKDYSKDSFYLSINATNNNDKITTYRVPLILEDTCKK